MKLWALGCPHFVLERNVFPVDVMNGSSGFSKIHLSDIRA